MGSGGTSSLSWSLIFLVERSLLSSTMLIRILLLKQYFSEEKEINRSVFQGTIMGPPFFNLFLNDLFLKFKSINITGYADDLFICFSHNSLDELILRTNETLSALNNWFLENGLMLSKEKTQILIFRNSTQAGPLIPIMVDNNIIEECSSMNILGVNVTPQFDWSNQALHVSKKLNKTCYLIRILRAKMDTNYLLTVYHANFISHIRYGIQFWGSSKSLKKILIIQKRCIRTIFGMTRRQSCREVFVNSELMTVFTLYIFEVCCHIHKHRNDLFSNKLSKHEYSTRSKLKITLDKNQNKFNKQVNNVLKIYNHLPNNVLHLDFKSFRKHLKKMFKTKCFYSIQEYLQTPFA